MVFKDAIWWYQERIVVPDVGSLRKDILFEFHDVFLQWTYGYYKDLKTD
jgi:hypothetical protein